MDELLFRAMLESSLFLGDPAYASLIKALARFEPRLTISCVAGLLTVPRYQPETLRIEILLHLACLHCRGKARPGSKEFSKWLEVVLAKLPVRRDEDPPEDVFVSNVIGLGGNYRIFEGIWEVNDYYLQDLLDCISRTRWALPHRDLRRSPTALLALSDAVVERSGLARWAASDQTVPSNRFLRSTPKLSELVARVTFTFADLAVLGIDAEALSPFFLPQQARPQLQREFLGHTTLERHPLINFGDAVVFACPTAASAAVRRYVMEWLAASGQANDFRALLRAKQRDSLGSVVRHMAMAPEGFTGGLPQDPPAVGANVSADAMICAIDVDKAAHIVLLHDEPDAVRTHGLTSAATLTEEAQKELEEHVVAGADYLRARSVGGLTLIVYGGLGRRVMLELPNLPDDWHVIVMSLPNLETFAWSEGASFLRLYKLHEQIRRALTNGVFVTEMNGTLNTYAFWRHQDFHLIPREFPYPSDNAVLHPGTNFIHDFRMLERKHTDEHAAPVDARRHVTVMRLHRDAFFASVEMQSIYASRDLASAGELAGVVEGKTLVIWVWASRPDDIPGVRQIVYDLWDGLLAWVNRAIEQLEGDLPPGSGTPMHVRVSLHESDEWSDFVTTAGRGEPEFPAVEVDHAQRTVRITLSLGFFPLLSRPTNDGERALLECAISGLLHLLEAHGHTRRNGDVEAIVSSAMPNADARSIHLFQAPSLPDHIQWGERRRPRLIQPEDWAECMAGIGWRVVDRSDHSKAVQVDELRECTATLNALVEVLWQDIRGELLVIDAMSLVRMALENSEAISRDRDRWRRTARAAMALYDGTENVEEIAGTRESERALASHGARVLVEMAICTCPRNGGRSVSHADYDRLSATVALLLEFAADSDVIRGGAARPWLQVQPNGTVERDHEFLAGVASPYVQESFATGFREAAANYDSYFEPRTRTSTEDRDLVYETSPFAYAFRCEYGLSPSRLIDAVAELLDLAHDSDRLVPTSTRGAITLRLREQRGFTDAECKAFWGAFALEPRERWDATLPGFHQRDWTPWRFRRRLSVVARPVVTLGTQADASVLFGVHQILASLSYLMENIQSASLPTEFFTSAEMRTYRGSVADAMGHAFTREVSTELRRLGWETCVEVELRSIGGPKEFGDIDVIAWHRSDGRLLLIECKRLQAARAVGEIVERLNEFRGESLDRLGKHLRRVGWVNGHLGSVQRKLGIPRTSERIVPLLVTNAEVPMQFKKDLALPPEQVIPVQQLQVRTLPNF